MDDREPEAAARRRVSAVPEAIGVFAPLPFDPGIFGPPSGPGASGLAGTGTESAEIPPPGLFAPPATFGAGAAAPPPPPAGEIVEAMSDVLVPDVPRAGVAARVRVRAVPAPPQAPASPRRLERERPLPQARVSDAGNGQALTGFILSVTGAAFLIFSIGLSSLLSAGLGMAGAAAARRGRERFESGQTRVHGGLARAGVTIGTVTAVLGVLAAILWIAVIASEAGASTPPR